MRRSTGTGSPKRFSRLWSCRVGQAQIRRSGQRFVEPLRSRTGGRSRMSEAFIVDAVRSPVGRRNGGLAQVHPADLGAHSIRALIERTGVDPAAVEDVVFGCVDTIGPQAGDIARTCWLVAGYPDEVPGTTVDRQCGSSQQAVHFAAA